MLNVKPRTIFCRDNIDILRGINPDCIDLIYLDPPFNKKKTFTALIGSSAEGAEFLDIFREEDIKDEWVDTIRYENEALHNYLLGVKSFSNSYNYCYLVYMAIRLLECHRVLKPTGAIYFHCDPTMSHYLKIVLDCIFGENNFRNEIVWGYRTGGISKKYLPRKHDIILTYGKTKHTKHNPIQEVVLYDKPFFTSNLAKNSAGKYEVNVYQRDVWDDAEVKPVINVSKERTGYPTQKPLKLLERIIKASSHEGDIVLDPFCGCATTCIAAEKLERRWIGIDVSIKAYELVKERLKKEVPADMFRGEPNFSTKPPHLSEEVDSRETGYVYVISNKKWAGEYKVGIARNVESRLNSYQTSDPDRGYKIEYKKATSNYKKIERLIHANFENKREWVQAKLSAIIQAIESYDI